MIEKISALLQKVTNFYREVVVEMGKVSWPSREQLQVSTIVVLVVTIIFAAFIGSFDALLSMIVDAVYQN